jgi:hypothetical protein
LTDGSLVYGVRIGGQLIDCVSMEDAETFASVFAALVDRHTNYYGITRWED